MHELDPIARPDAVDPPAWEAMKPGERVRALKYAEDGFPLPAKVYLQLRELPTWAFYGPEQGLPEDWFNLQGFLLPRFRPGGGDHPVFLAWTREFRLRRRVSASLRQAWGSRWRWVGGWIVVALVVTLALVIAFVVRPAVESRGGLPWLPQAVAVAAGAAAVLSWRWLLPRVERNVILWILWRRTGRRTADRFDAFLDAAAAANA